MKTKVFIIAVALLFLGAAAYALSQPEQQFVALINEERALENVPTLVVDSELSDVAQAWSETMLSEQNLYHNPDLGSQVSDWDAVGENVGVGSNVEVLHNAFMASADHRSNILNERWTLVGVGVAEGDSLWVTQIFMDPQESRTTISSGLYVDDHEISSVHREAVYSLKERGIMTGYRDGTFRPQEPITRQQLASIVNELLEHR